ncbi:MAG: FtsX-like permease family protein [Puniceicoccales bacterium]|jgi:lipoprotein-releasing system permease protein|nr:FtsX-like permease family protein [Puniceicoccales bacterium]
MSTNLKIALRFLLFKKRAMLMTLSGITFGVAFFILTQAQTSGFEQFFIRTVLGTDSALRVADRFQDTKASREIAASGDPNAKLRIETLRKYIEGIDYPSRLREMLAQHAEVAASAEVLRGSARVESPQRSADAQIFGINLRDFRRVSNLEDQIVSGDIALFDKSPQGVLVGSELARRLNAVPGQILTLTVRNVTQRFNVSGIFETGIGDIDKVRIIAHLGATRSLLKRPFGATYLQVSLNNPDLAPAVAERIGPLVRHHIAPWQKRERVWLEVFRMLRFSSAITVSTIILVSALGMFNTLAMLVIEKTREIAILRSFGFSKGDVTRIFLWLGWVVIVVGSVLGCAMGALLTWAAENIPLRIRGIFSTDHFLVSWNSQHYLAAVLTAVVVVSIASYFPARRAAHIEPGDIIRGASS